MTATDRRHEQAFCSTATRPPIAGEQDGGDVEHGEEAAEYLRSASMTSATAAQVRSPNRHLHSGVYERCEDCHSWQYKDDGQVIGEHQTRRLLLVKRGRHVTSVCGLLDQR
jgi:hypothetical protein